MQFGVLGPLLVQVAEVPVALPSARQRTLLATLLLRPGQVVTAETLISRIWDDRPPANARGALQIHVARLRQLLGDADPAAERIVTRPGGYALELMPHDEVDLLRFEELLAAADRAGDDAAAEADLVGSALTIWRGPALADIPSESLHQEHDAALAERRLGAVQRHVAAGLRLDRHAALVPELRTLTGEHPLRERFWAQLVTALGGAGQRAEAFTTYRQVRALLVRELGVEPGPELRAAHARLLAHEPRQLAVPAQLPADIAAFTGRTGYLQRLDAATGSGLCAVVGPAGIGKTALAVHWAHRIRACYPDGQLYVNLRGFSATPPLSPADALAGFLRALGVPADEVPADPDEAAGLFRTVLADRRVLVLLDNAAGAEQVRPLIPGGSGCHTVVTSRHRLTGLVAADGAERIALAALPAAESRALLVRTLGADMVGAEPAAAERLASLCGHLPLALRIVAANIADGPPGGIGRIAGRLATGDDRLAVLTIDGDEANAVRAVFGLSEAVLPPATRRLFHLLGLAPVNDLSVSAAAAIGDCPPAEAERMLDTLVAAHLLDQPAPGRYLFHDLLGLYAAEQARHSQADEQRAAAVRRLLDWYLCTADAAAETVYPQRLRLRPADAGPAGRFPDVGAALAWLDAEAPNLVAAVRFAADPATPHAWLLADALRGYFAIRGAATAWTAVAGAALDAALAAGDARAEAAARYSLAEALMRYGSRPAAVAEFEAVIPAARRAGWRAGEAAVLGMLGNIERVTGRPAAAEVRMDRARTLFAELGLPGGEAGSLGNRGLALRELGRIPEAVAAHRRALGLYREIGSTHGEAMALGNLAESLLDLGATGEAATLVEQALVLHERSGDRTGSAESRRIRATVRREAGDLPAALADALAALDAARSAGDRNAECVALDTLASVRVAASDSGAAVATYGQALALADETENVFASVQSAVGLAAACRQAGDAEAARRHAQDAALRADAHGYAALAAAARLLLA